MRVNLPTSLQVANAAVVGSDRSYVVTPAESCKEAVCIILGDLKESDVFLMEASEESIMIIQPRCHSGMYYSGTGVLVQILPDPTKPSDVKVHALYY